MKTNSTLLISLGIVIGVTLAILMDSNTTTLLIAGGLVIVSIVVTPIMIKLARGLTKRNPTRLAKTRKQARGTVKWFNYKKGFGFIEQENGEDVFVHHNSIVNGKKRPLREGQKVSMDIVQGAKGPQAENVSLL